VKYVSAELNVLVEITTCVETTLNVLLIGVHSHYKCVISGFRYAIDLDVN
jgi:hypothetical protein